jgi:pimeloyl-ACP methyl ester carboxylesterase
MRTDSQLTLRLVRKISIGASVSLLLLVIAAGVYIFGTRPQPIQAQDGVQLTPLRTISITEARVLLFLTRVKGIAVRNAVDLYRMHYTSTRPDGTVVPLSGLLALPRGHAPRRLVSFQHGTTTTRSAVPSKPDGTGIATAIVFAGNGYALVVPDYPGLGDSPGRHPYYVAEAIGPAVVAMIAAAQQLQSVPKSSVFLSGFSEGAWASLAALRILESEGDPVLGSALVAGAYDLRHVSLPASMSARSPAHSLYLAYAAWGQSQYYGHPLDTVLTPEYAQLVDRLFEGATPQEILSALPENPRQIFNRSLLDAYDHGAPHWFLDTLAANSLVGMTSHAPVRFYYGSADTEVSPEESVNAARAMAQHGTDARSSSVGPVGHDASMLEAAPRILAWLGELEAPAQ